MDDDTITPAEQAEGLRASVRDFRNPATRLLERKGITDWWTSLGIPNQFAAMLRAAEIEKAAER